MTDQDKELQRLTFELAALTKENAGLCLRLKGLETTLEKEVDLVRSDIKTLVTKSEFKEAIDSLLKKEVFTVLFTPVQRAYYGFIVLMAMAVGGAILNLVIKK